MESLKDSSALAEICTAFVVNHEHLNQLIHMKSIPNDNDFK
jgi:hypothetical protein